MKNCYKILTLLALLFTAIVPKANAQQDLLDLAATQYDSAHYQTTIDAYEQVLNAYGANPALYYNLGGTYYKMKNYPKAILNYERCLLFDPSNTDAASNLELAQMQCVDKIEAIEPIIFVTWSNAIRDWFSCDTWGWMAIITFLLFLGGCGLYFFGRKTFLRKSGFYGGLICVVLCFIFNFYAGQQQDRIQQRDYAIVMTPSVIVRSSPAESGTQLFTIHEGLKVKVRSTLSGWSEIELSDGNVGWMPSEGLEVI